MNIEKLFEALPDVIGTEADLDAALTRIGKVPAWDRAKLSAIRTLAVEGRLVVRDAEGRIVKAAALPTGPTDAELLKARQAREIAERFPPMFAPHWSGGELIGVDDRRHPRFRAEREAEAELLRIVAPRFEALETQVRELQGQLDALTAARELTPA